MYECEIKGKLDKKLQKMAKRERISYRAIVKKIEQIVEDPYLGKPLHGLLKGKRRIHRGHFVLIYEVDEKGHKVAFLDFAHHDDAYK